MAKWRNLAAAAALSTTLALGTTPAYAFDAVVGQPPEIGWGTIADALSDGRVDAGDLAGPAFQAFWAAASATITKVQICREAYAEFYSRGNNSAFTFYGNVTVVSADGSTRLTYRQPIRVIPQANGTLVVGWAKGDGRYAKAYRCGGGNAAQNDADLESASIDHLGGATSLSFDVPEGRISVFLPTDMAVGDRISGRVLAEPAGDNEIVRAENRARLSGYVVDVGGNETSVGDGEFSFAIIAVLIGLSVGEGDNVVSEGVIQVAENASQFGNLPTPTVTQAGSPVTVPGQFDGVAGNSQATIGGQDCPILAESPRQTTFVAPQQPTGPVAIRVDDGGGQSVGDNFAYEGHINNVDVALSAGRTTLARGQSTRVTVDVTGLQDIATPVQVDLHASSTVRLQGGNDQTLTVQPRDVRNGGFQRTLKAGFYPGTV